MAVGRSRAKILWSLNSEPGNMRFVIEKDGGRPAGSKTRGRNGPSRPVVGSEV